MMIIIGVIVLIIIILILVKIFILDKNKTINHDKNAINGLVEGGEEFETFSTKDDSKLTIIKNKIFKKLNININSKINIQSLFECVENLVNDDDYQLIIKNKIKIFIDLLKSNEKEFIKFIEESQSILPLNNKINDTSKEKQDILNFTADDTYKIFTPYVTQGNINLNNFKFLTKLLDDIYKLYCNGYTGIYKVLNTSKIHKYIYIYFLFPFMMGKFFMFGKMKIKDKSKPETLDNIYFYPLDGYTHYDNTEKTIKWDEKDRKKQLDYINKLINIDIDELDDFAKIGPGPVSVWMNTLLIEDIYMDMMDNVPQKKCE